MSVQTVKTARAGRAASKSRREKTANILCFLLLVVLGLVVMFPIYWIFRSSLMSNGELYAYPPAFVPPEWRFQNYPETLKSFEYLKFLGNTMTILLPAVFGAVITATMNTYWPLILPHFCGGGAFNIFLIRQFVKTVPRELDEAATIDGCGYFRILIFIIVPAVRAAMIVVGLLKFIELWNDLLQQVTYITRRERYTLALGLNIFRGSFNDDWSSIMCATCLSFIPGIVFYLIGQRYFVEGIVMTGMKN